MQTIRFRIAFFSLISCLALGASWQLSQAQEDIQTESDTTAVTEWLPPGNTITTSALNADAPQISASPTTDEVLIVFNGWTGSESGRDPYFVRSTNNGSSWTAAAAMATDSNTRSTVHVTHDTAGNAHVVWLNFNQNSQSYSLEYGKKTSSATSWSTKTLISSTNGSGMSNAIIGAQNSTTLDIVFEGAIDGSNPNPTIWHIRSTDGGDTWGAATRVNPSVNNPSTNPDMEYDDSGTLHVTWEQQTATGGSDVYYSRYAGSAWSSSLLLSGDSLVLNDARKPSLEIGNSTIYVAYSHGRATNPDQQQIVYGMTCAQTNGTCESIDDWASIANYSSQAVKVNQSNPFYVTPELAYDANTSSMVLFFHGIRSGNTDTNELIWQNDSCNKWSIVETVTSDTAQSIKPSVQIESGLVHLAYEDVANEIIYYIQNTTECQAGLIHYLAYFTR